MTMKFGGLTQHVLETERRRAERKDVFLRTILRFDDGTAIPIELVNISRVGFMARSHDPVPHDMRMRIVLPEAGKLAAQIAWSLGGRIGCEFREPIDTALYSRLIAALPRDS